MRTPPLINALAEAAAAWQDPDYEPRDAAVTATLAENNRFTEEAVAFAVNQQMALLTPVALQAWVGSRTAAVSQTVGVLHAGNVPLAGLQDFLAVLLTGHRYLGVVSSKSPHLLPAFAADVARLRPGLPVQFATAEVLFEEAAAVIATGSNETRAWVAAQCAAHGIPPARCLLRGHRFAVAVIDGHEDADEWEGLAEDVLLHEGYGCRNVALIWAPKGLAPDALLAAFAAFRAVFPAHPETPGALKLQQAFLAATGQPHAYGDGLEFLLSRGSPEVQRPGHVRWTDYERFDEVTAWLAAHRDEIQLVVARPQLADALRTFGPVAIPGDAQRPALDWHPDGQDTIAFLAAR